MAQVIVKTRARLVPPLVQPRSPEFPPGVKTVTFGVPEAEITAVVTAGVTVTKNAIVAVFVTALTPA